MAAFETLQAEASGVWESWLGSRGPRIVVQCSSCSIAAGAQETLAALQEQAQQRGLRVEVGIVGCMGACYAEPIVAIARPGAPRVLYGWVTAKEVPSLVEEVLVRDGLAAHRALGVLGEEWQGIPSVFSLPFFRGQERRLLRNSGVINPESIDHYLAQGGYEGLHRALSSMTPEEVIAEVKASGLTGRGGAYFPCGLKWEFLRNARSQTKYLICNADEGDPGAFVNRTTMESDPHLLVEGMIIAAYATGATQGYVYLRHEYPLSAQRMRGAIAQARQRGLLGQGILGSALNFDLEVVVGAGSYLCGEETGLIASLQDGRGMPRTKPPFPAQSGLFWQPTNVNNVETYADASLILRHGAAWFASVGIKGGMEGTKLFSLSGAIARPGVVEVPLGTPVRTVVGAMGGGVPEGRALKAIQTGGPLGGILPGRLVDLPLERNAFAQEGALVGSGGLVVIDERACMVDLCRLFMRFNQDESCARCTTCRIGTMRLVDLLDRVAAGLGREEDVTIMENLDAVMKNANCVHGQAAPTPVMSLLRHFREELMAHILEKRCEARVCQGLSRFVIVPYWCTACGDCQPVCPTDAVVQGEPFVILQDKCIQCALCAVVCPEDAVELQSPVAAAVPVAGERRARDNPFAWLERSVRQRRLPLRPETGRS